MGRTNALILFSILVSSLFMILVPVHSVDADAVRVYVDPPVVVDPAVLFNVSIKVDNLVNLAAAQWEVTWDPTLLRAVAMTEIMFHEVTPQSELDNIWRLEHTIDNVAGRAMYTYLWQDMLRAERGGYLPISGNHTMASISFQVIGIGNCTIQLTRSGTRGVKLAGADFQAIECSVTDGFFSNSLPPSPLPPLPIESSEVLIYVDPRRVKNESLTIGETFQIDVKMDSLTSHQGLVSSLFMLSWNSTLLNCINVTEVMFHEVLPESEWQNIDWSFRIWNPLGYMLCQACFKNIFGSELGEHAIFGNHTLATITFMVNNTGRSRLRLFDCYPIEYSPHAYGPDGCVQMLYSKIDGYFANTLNGELNGDNIVDLFDALVLAKSFGALPDLQSWNEDADINGDGFIDIYDALLLCGSFGHSSARESE